MQLHQGDEIGGTRPAGGDVVYPVKPGDWVQRRGEPGEVALVKDVAVEEPSGAVLVDLYVYSRNGDREGRRSPAMGGPRTFEPCCDWAGWERIEEPRFPIRMHWVPSGNGTSVMAWHSGAKVLPEREWSKPPRRRRRAAAVRTVPRSDYDPQLEASARRMAAQELRDMIRNATPEALRQRAEQLEAEAEAINPRS